MKILFSELKPGQKFTDLDGDAAIMSDRVHEDGGRLGWYHYTNEPNDEEIGWSGIDAWWGCNLVADYTVECGWPQFSDLPPDAQVLVNLYNIGYTDDEDDFEPEGDDS